MRTLAFAIAFCSLFVVATGLSADELQIGRPLEDPPIRAASIPPSTLPDGIAVVIPPHMPDTLLVSKPGKYEVEPNSRVRITLAVDPKRFPSVQLKSSTGEKGGVRIGGVTKTRSIESGQTSSAEVDLTIVDVDLTVDVNNPESPYVEFYEFEIRRPEERDESEHDAVEFLPEPGAYSLKVGSTIRVQFEGVTGLVYDALASGKLKRVAERVVRTKESGGDYKLVSEFEFRAVEAGSAKIELRDPTSPERKSSGYSIEIRP